jgi:formyl-CoA transferase
MSATPTTVTRGAPTLGEHTDEVLESLGIGADERSALRERGVLGG